MLHPIKLIVGLGNPGKKYDNTRHNAGFDFIDLFSQKNNITLKDSKKFYGDVAKVGLFDKEFWLLRPNTFVNKSGQSVAALAKFYKIPTHSILVVYDELDLEPGTAKLKKAGGHGGHNGLRDIIKDLGSNKFLRLRIGVGHPGDRNKVVSWVLNKATSNDELKIKQALQDSLEIMPDLINGHFEKAMKDLHTQKTS